MQGGRLFPVRDDWYEWQQVPPLPAQILVRVIATPGGRLIIGGLQIDGEPTAELLRSIPVGRIEAAANAQLIQVDPTPSGSLSRLRPPSRPHWPGTVRASAPAPVLDGWETTEPAQAADRLNGVVPDDPRRGRPDRFYSDVAAAYLVLAQATPRPAAELAQTHGVPPTTAHRWIKEARRRGFLPPGRPGKAG